MKKVLSSIFCAALLFGTFFSPGATEAQEKEKKVKEVVSNGEVTLEVTEDGQVYDAADGGEIISVKSFEDGVGKEITVVEYVEKIRKQGKEKKEKEKMDKKDKETALSSKRVPFRVNSITGEITPDCIACVGGISWRYNESSYANVTGSKIKASNNSFNCTLDNMNKTLSYSASKTHAMNISLTTDEWKAFKAGVSYTFTSMATVTGTDTMTIRPKYYGWFDFYPYIRTSTGYLKTYQNNSAVISSKYISASYPKLIGGILNGDLVAKVAAASATQLATYCPK